MLIGTSLADITPALGASLAGYFHDRRASGMYDPLYAKALVVGQDENALAVVALDLIGLPREQIERMRQRAHELCAIAPQRIIVACTHTHLGPVTLPIFQSPFDPGWLGTIPEKGARAIAEAWQTRRDHQFAIATGRLEGVAFNRRYWMKSGRVETNPGRGNPDIIRPAGPIDPEVGVLVWGDPNRPAAILVSFTCHLDTIGGDRISADYPAYMAAHVRDRLGEVAVIFLNGAFGDINHVDVSRPAQRQGIEQAKWMGELLGAEVLRALAAAQQSASQQLDERHVMLQIPLREISDQAIHTAREIMAAAPGLGEMTAEQMYAREVLLLAESEKREVTAEIQALRIGDAAFVGLPGEPFVELGLRLKRGSPFRHTYVVGLANGCEGYIPTRAAFEEGGYEIRTARSSKLHPESGDMMVAAGAELLAALRHTQSQ
jgi:hypothetical protein